MANIRRDLAKLDNDDREPSTDPDVRRLSELLAGLTECLDGLDGRLGAASARGTPSGSGSNNNNTQMVTVDSPRGRSMAKREKGAAGDNLLTIVEETSTEQTHTVTQDASGKRINQTVTSTNKRSTRSFPPNTNKPRSPMGAGRAAGGNGGGAGASGAGKR